MKNLVLILMAFLFLTVNQSLAYNAKYFSKDTKIIAAINLLERSGEDDVLRSLQRHGVKIKFSDLSIVSYNSSKVFAVSTYNQYGTRVILINSIYRNAPVEQIACLIAHESCHTGNIADLEEETLATQKEAACWTRLKDEKKSYVDNKLTRRLDKLSQMYLASDENTNYVEQKIANSGFYRSQYGIN